MITIACNCNHIRRSLRRTLVRQVILFNFLIKRGPGSDSLNYRLAALKLKWIKKKCNP